MTFPGEQDDIVLLRQAHGKANSLCSIRLDMHGDGSFPHSLQHVRNDLFRFLGTRVIRCNNRHIRKPRDYRAQFGAFGSVAVASAAKYAENPPVCDLPQEERIFSKPSGEWA